MPSGCGKLYFTFILTVHIHTSVVQRKHIYKSVKNDHITSFNHDLTITFSQAEVCTCNIQSVYDV